MRYRGENPTGHDGLPGDVFAGPGGQLDDRPTELIDHGEGVCRGTLEGVQRDSRGVVAGYESHLVAITLDGPIRVRS